MAIIIIVPGVPNQPTLLESKPHPDEYVGSGPGGPQRADSQVEGPLLVVEHIHGWPWTYCRRAQGFGGKGWPNPRNSKQNDPLLIFGHYFVSWSVPNAWPLKSDASDWDVLALAGDAVIGLSIVALFTLLWERRIRRRGGLLRLNLRDMFVLTLCVAYAAGWWSYNSTEAREEERAISLLTESRSLARLNQPGFPNPIGDTEYRGPEWLRRLLGDPYLLSPQCFRVTGLVVDSQMMSEKHWGAVDSLHQLERLVILGVAAREDLPESAERAIVGINEVTLREPPSERKPSSGGGFY